MFAALKWLASWRGFQLLNGMGVVRMFAKEDGDGVVEDGVDEVMMDVKVLRSSVLHASPIRSKSFRESSTAIVW